MKRVNLILLVVSYLKTTNILILISIPLFYKNMYNNRKKINLEKKCF